MKAIQQMKQKVLLLDDDNESLIPSLRHSLSLEAYEIVPANSIQHAGAKSDAGEIDLLLMNLDSTTEDGWAAISKITRENPFMPVIVISSQLELRNPAEAAGVCAFVEKPVDVLLLLQTIRELLAEPFQRRVARVCNCVSDFRYLLPSSGPERPAHDFRNLLHRRSAVPFDFRLSTSRWKINK